ncbi:hypothetical protein OHB05_38985 [Streptomyces sp. NBC_00638]|uniref:hypothetical protein n=1 Tax=unclassified Streptomyces TaxID=2593676 RepID=UPI00224D2935|nr:hypothetical protein [Streptomyces sp. NBC_00638]MCX5008544.1 hypothetical protein [Streptomyces sp. NBC_00638]
MLSMFDPGLALIAVSVVMSLWFAADCLHTPAERIRFVPKLVWLLFLFHGSVFAALVWVYFGKKALADTAKNGPNRPVDTPKATDRRIP